MCIECNKKRAYQRILDNMDEHRELIKINNQRPNIIQIKREFGKKQRENGYQTEYRRNNQEKFKGYSSDRRHKNHKVTKTEWKACKQYFKNRCAYCGLPIEEHYNMYDGKLRKEDLNKEHVDHMGSIFLDNCVPACKSCNDHKWEFKLEDWYNENNPNYTKERYNKIIKWLTEDCFKYIEEKKPRKPYTRKTKSV